MFGQFKIVSYLCIVKQKQNDYGIRNEEVIGRKTCK
jgi:hypothetical protein